MVLRNLLIVYAPENKPVVRIACETLPAGSTIHDALNHVHFYTLYPETLNLPVGIFSKQKSLDTLLKSGDRIEIYRPLRCDPKERRRQKHKVAQRSIRTKQLLTK